MDKVLGSKRPDGSGEGGHWLSVSDLMAGLMVVFMFISIALMRSAILERDRIKEIAVAYQDNQVRIYTALMKEFAQDLEHWQANINQETLAFEFQAPDVLFRMGETEVRPRFKEILQDFFPRYLDTLRKFKDSISEIRIEGHTSSVWNGEVSQTEAYFRNMWLSQGRTRAVLRYVYGLPKCTPDRTWVKRHFAAVGYSSSRLIRTPEGKEDRARSRRVTFRVMTNAETQIRKIIQEPL